MLSKSFRKNDFDCRGVNSWPSGTPELYSWLYVCSANRSVAYGSYLWETILRISCFWWIGNLIYLHLLQKKREPGTKIWLLNSKVESVTETRQKWSVSGCVAFAQSELPVDTWNLLQKRGGTREPKLTFEFKSWNCNWNMTEVISFRLCCLCPVRAAYGYLEPAWDPGLALSMSWHFRQHWLSVNETCPWDCLGPILLIWNRLLFPTKTTSNHEQTCSLLQFLLSCWRRLFTASLPETSIWYLAPYDVYVTMCNTTTLCYCSPYCLLRHVVAGVNRDFKQRLRRIANVRASWLEPACDLCQN